MNEWKKIGEFGVDSGQVIITDPCYLESFNNDEFNQEKIEEMQKSGVYEYSYNGTCAKTLSKEMAGNIGKNEDAVVASTGFGDGVYPVYALYENGRIKEIKIKFF